MKTLEVRRGSTLATNIHWVSFVLVNSDIMTALNPASPLSLRPAGENKFSGSVFGVTLEMEVIRHDYDGLMGTIKVLSDIRLPLGLGRTFTVAQHKYFCINDQTTSLDTHLTIELTRLMRPYVFLRRDDIEKYLNRLCSDIEAACQALSSEGAVCAQLLSEEQLGRVRLFRKKTARLPAWQSSQDERRLLDAAMRVGMTHGTMLVAAEASLPDKRVLTASETLCFDDKVYAGVVERTENLARINNRALAFRGATASPSEQGDFQQAALELGYDFYRRVCGGQLLSVMPVVVAQGDASILRLLVDGRAEELPWEIMHDGQQFISLRVRFTRCIAATQRNIVSADAWTSSGVLVVGADAKGDLPGVEVEARTIGDLLRDAGIRRVEVLAGRDADRCSILSAVDQGGFNVLHFCGHSTFDSQKPFQSKLELFERPLFLHELGALSKSGRKPLNLVFLNSCQSAAVGQEKVTGRQLGMCRALRESGVAYVIGMAWNVEDRTAAQLGATFYKALMAQPDLGPEEALRRARNHVGSERAWADGSWLAPVLYS